MTSFTVLDWFVLISYGVGMLVVGWVYSRKTKSQEDYLLGGRNMSAWMVGISLFASLLSTVSYLAVPGEIIKHGPMILAEIIIYPFIAWAVGWWIIPVIMQQRVTSAYEILEKKLGLGIRMAGSVIFVMLRLLWMGLILYATCDKILVPVLKLDPSFTPWLSVILAVVTIIYTSMGGIKAVVFTDVVQTFILFGGAVLTLILINNSLGGVNQWWPRQWNPDWAKPVLFSFNSRMSFGAVFIASFSWYVCTCGSDQIAVQRYLSTRDAKQARRAFSINLLTGGIVNVFLAILGFALFAYYSKQPGGITDADKLLPMFIVNGLPQGITGLVIAGLLAAAMSSLSSGLNSSCSVITVDFIERFRKAPITGRKAVHLNQLISVLVGVVVVCLGLLVEHVPGNLFENAFRVANLLVAPLFVLFFLALFVKKANKYAAWPAILISAATAILIAYWPVFFGVAGISFLWIIPGSFITGSGTGIVITYCLSKGKFQNA